MSFLPPVGSFPKKPFHGGPGWEGLPISQAMGESEVKQVVATISTGQKPVLLVISHSACKLGDPPLVNLTPTNDQHATCTRDDAVSTSHPGGTQSMVGVSISRLSPSSGPCAQQGFLLLGPRYFSQVMEKTDPIRTCKPAPGTEANSQKPLHTHCGSRSSVPRGLPCRGEQRESPGLWPRGAASARRVSGSSPPWS